MKRFKEPLKTLLILLLTASAVFLAVRGGFFGAFFPEKPQASAVPTAAQEGYPAAALPMAAAVTGPGGLRCGVKYDAEALADLYEGFSAALAEALGSAEAPQALPEEGWRSRLREESLYLDYGFALPLTAMAAWVGVSADRMGDAAASALLLDGGEEGGVRLSFRGGDGRFYTCDTAASWATLRRQLGDYRPNGAAFAFEQDRLENCEPYLLLLERLPAVWAGQAEEVHAEAARVFGEVFGVNLGGQNHYAEADGTLVYPGEAGVLRIARDGWLSYASAETAFAPSAAAEDRIETARKLLETLHAPWAGDEDLVLSGIQEGPDGGFALRFSYALNGVTVEQDEGPAATVEWKPDGQAELTLRPLRFRSAKEAQGLLPERQAAAAAGSLHKGAEARLVLQAMGVDRFEPAWVVAADGRILWTQGD